MKNAKYPPALKAVSQNLMLSNLSITDEVYGVLSESDVRGQIVALGKKISTDNLQDNEAIIPLLEKLLERLKGK